LGKTATIIAVSYLVVVVPSIAVALAVWRSMRARDGRVDRELLARRERTWLWIVVALLAGLLFATIFFTPYVEEAGAEKQVVRVTGVQFAWAIEPSTVWANVPSTTC
jgi:heme/copper-type cytochrome/quinol oxidase subunit 2